MFDNVINPEANKGRETLSDSELLADVFLMMAAGMDTTANTLTVGTWEILRNVQIYNKLMAELRAAIPQIDVEPSSDTLDKLPYLVKLIIPAVRLVELNRNPGSSSQRMLAAILWKFRSTLSKSASSRYNNCGTVYPRRHNRCT